MQRSRLLWRVTAVLLAALLLAGLRVYPPTDFYLPAALSVLAAVVYVQPHWLWLLLPPSLAMLDLAPITGWYFLEEIDLLLALFAALVYARAVPCSNATPALPRLARGGAFLLGIGITVATITSWPRLAATDFMSMNDYLSPYNGLRTLKVWAWLLIYLPLLRLHMAQQPALRDQLLLPGMLAGLVCVVYRALMERWQFPGLLNLASDYRITAPFSAMHTGGAALDGYLAMCLPLLALCLWPSARAERRYIALMLLPLALYASLATFSRGLYLALAAACTLLMSSWASLARASGGQVANATAQTGRIAPPYSLRLVQALSVIAQLQLCFDIAGYRGMLAAAGAFLMAGLPVKRGGSATLWLLGGVFILAIVAMLSTVLGKVDKLPYVAYLVSALSYYCLLIVRNRLAPVALGCLLGASIWICVYHAGTGILGLASSQLLAVWLLRCLLAQEPPAVTLGKAQLPSVWLVALVVTSATAIPFYNAYFVAQRFATTQPDLAVRWQHWQGVLALMAHQPAGYLLGVGAGNYPMLYYWFNRDNERPAHASFVAGHNGGHLHLYAGSTDRGYGEPLRVLQRVALKPHSYYQLSLDVASAGITGYLQVRLCARQLLYPTGCVSIPQQTVAATSPWQQRRFTLMSGVLDGQRFPVQLELAAEGNGAAINIGNVSLIELASGAELLRNGSFKQRHNYWFFSSDHHHLPWHIKNLLLNLYFEYGPLGLLGYLLLLASAILALRPDVQGVAGRWSARVWLAALLAFQVVGLFDSLIDVPRILLLHLLTLFAILYTSSIDLLSRHVN